MKKNHIYSIEDTLEKKDVVPSPGAYEPDKSFG
jgi:hypothetical protein